VILSF